MTALSRARAKYAKAKYRMVEPGTTFERIAMSDLKVCACGHRKDEHGSCDTMACYHMDHKNGLECRCECAVYRPTPPATPVEGKGLPKPCPFCNSFAGWDEKIGAWRLDHNAKCYTSLTNDHWLKGEKGTRGVVEYIWPDDLEAWNHRATGKGEK